MRTELTQIKLMQTELVQTKLVRTELAQTKLIQTELKARVEIQQLKAFNSLRLSVVVTAEITTELAAELIQIELVQTKLIQTELLQTELFAEAVAIVLLVAVRY